MLKIIEKSIIINTIYQHIKPLYQINSKGLLSSYCLTALFLAFLRIPLLAKPANVDKTSFKGITSDDPAN